MSVAVIDDSGSTGLVSSASFTDRVSVPPSKGYGVTFTVKRASTVRIVLNELRAD